MVKVLSPGFELIREYTLYDTFVIKPGRDPFKSLMLFMEPLSGTRSFLETNVRAMGGIFIDQKFRPDRMRIEFLNFPLSWDVGAFARSCTFSFMVGQRPYLDCPCRDLLIEESKAQVLCPPDLLVEGGAMMQPKIYVEKSPMILDPEGGGLVGRLLVTGDLMRPVQ